MTTRTRAKNETGLGGNRGRIATQVTDDELDTASVDPGTDKALDNRSGCAGIHLTWSEYLTAVHVAFAAGVEHERGEHLRDERLAEAAAFAAMATRLRATAGEPSYTKLVDRTRRHEVEAANRATGHAWPQEVA